MGVWEIVLIVFCVAVVAGVAIACIIRKKKGKHSCNCDCADCPMCSHCNTKQK